jgi:hypothetical protein
VKLDLPKPSKALLPSMDRGSPFVSLRVDVRPAPPIERVPLNDAGEVELKHK